MTRSAPAPGPALYALAHDHALMVPAPDGVADVISDVVSRHRDEVTARLAELGVAFEDLLEPTWMMSVRAEAVEAYPYAAAPAPARADAAYEEADAPLECFDPACSCATGMDDGDPS